LTYGVRVWPSEPTTKGGSARPRPIGAGPRPPPGAAAVPPPSRPPAPACPEPVEGAPRWGDGWLSTAAPLPGSPTALPLRTPPRRPPPVTGAALASGVRRLGIATRPPGQSNELDGR